MSTCILGFQELDFVDFNRPTIPTLFLTCYHSYLKAEITSNISYSGQGTPKLFRAVTMLLFAIKIF